MCLQVELVQGDPEEEGEEGEGAAKGGRQLRTGPCAACNRAAACKIAMHALGGASEGSGGYQTGQRMLSKPPSTSCAYHVSPHMCCPRGGG